MRKFAVFLISVITISCIKPTGKIFTEGRILLGTQVNISILCENEKTASAVFDAVFAEISRLEKLFSPYIADSDVSRLNRGEKFKVSPETYEIILRSLEISKETEGSFDITFASAADLWKIRGKEFVPPSDSEIKNSLNFTGYAHVLCTPEGVISFNKKGMKIGLGGIAKGYVAEKICAMISGMGVSASVVEAGGDCYMDGEIDGGWPVLIRSPRGGGIAASMRLSGGKSVVTSGDYERFTEYNGKRYSHIINPLTAMPAEGLISVTVIAGKGADADAYATAMSVMGMPAAADFLLKKKNVSAVIIDQNYNVYVSKSLKGNIKFAKEIKPVFI